MALKTPAFNDAKTYGFEWVRAMIEASLQEGVLNMGGAGTDFRVAAAGAGGMRVDVAAGAALIKGDSGVPGAGLTQGLFLAINDALIANAVTLNAADGANPRIDQIVARIYDSSDLGSGADQVTLEVLTGAPTSGATLDNRNGAAALGNDRLRLADILVPAASVAVTAGNIRDRRPWARGARIIATGTAGGNYTVNNAGASLDTTRRVRVELSGAPVRYIVFASTLDSAANGQAIIQGEYVGPSSGQLLAINATAAAAYGQSGGANWTPAPAGSYLIGLWGSRPSGTGVITVVNTITSVPEIHVEEVLGQSSLTALN